MNKEERIEIYKETVQIVNDGGYESYHLVDFDFPDDNYMECNTIFYDKAASVNHKTLERYNTEVSVVNEDCLYEAKKLKDLGLEVAVLNMASYHTPGGGVTRGSSAQEESIFRRTNIFKSLYQFHDIGKNYGVDQIKESRYPLNYNFGGIYSPSVTVFRAAERDSCELLDEPFTVDVISVPAVKNPKVRNGKLAPWVVDTLKTKIRQIFDIALSHGNDALVLSAFGCGAYGTPPSEMARLFKEVIDSEKYKGAFKVIRFAIIDVPSTNGAHNPQGNIKPFTDVFGE